MTFTSYLQRQAKACLKLSEIVADERLSDRIKAMAEACWRKRGRLTIEIQAIGKPLRRTGVGYVRS
jgi:hypothetical protein